MKKILLLLLNASAVSAIAENNGYYVGANLGFASVQGTGQSSSDIATGAKNSTLGLGVNAGYSFNTNIAVEVDYFMLPSYSYSESIGLISKSTWSNDFLFATVRGTLPLASNFDFFAKLGTGVNFANAEISYTNTSVSKSYSSTNFAGSFGFGFNYNINKQFTIKLQNDYMMAPKQLSDNQVSLGRVNLLSLGMEYKF